MTARGFTLWLCCLTLLVTPIRGWAQGERRATVVNDAPVYATPSTDGSPLRVARAGSSLIVEDVQGDWTRIQFQDPEQGRRTGYMRTATLKFSAERVPGSAAQSPPVPGGPTDYKRSRSQGFFLGGAFEGAAGRFTEEGVPASTASGPGFGIIVGYGFNRTAALFVGLSGAQISSDNDLSNRPVGHFDVGLRLHFLGPQHRARPFIHGALTGLAYQEEFFFNGLHTLEATGAGGSFGGGVHIYFTPAVAFTPSLTWSFGRLSNYKVDNVKIEGTSLSVASARVAFGVTWFPKEQ